MKRLSIKTSRILVTMLVILLPLTMSLSVSAKVAVPLPVIGGYVLLVLVVLLVVVGAQVSVAKIGNPYALGVALHDTRKASARRVA